MPSSVVSKFYYDQSRSVLRVIFVSGLVYEYLQVPEEVYLAMKEALSKGTFLNEHIKKNYEFKKIE